MTKVLLGEIKTGRLRRLQYLGYSLLLSLLLFGFGLAVVLAIGAGERIIGGDLQQAQDQLRDMFTLPVMLVFAVIMPLFFFVGANIMAKRIRDIGLPGWWMVLAIVVTTGVVSYVVSSEASSALHTLVLVVLLLVPGDVFGRGT